MGAGDEPETKTLFALEDVMVSSTSEPRLARRSRLGLDALTMPPMPLGRVASETGATTVGGGAAVPGPCRLLDPGSNEGVEEFGDTGNERGDVSPFDDDAVDDEPKFAFCRFRAGGLSIGADALIVAAC